MPNRNITVGIICGGPSPEADVSRLSAGRISPVLKKHYQNVITLELDKTLPADLLHHRVDVVFPVAHGPMGEDGCLQGLLEVMAIPYVGSGVLGSACAMDKVTTKRILQTAGVPMAKDCVVHRDTSLEQSVDMCIATLGEHVIIKPLAQGSGIGIQFASGPQELGEKLSSGFEKDERLLIEMVVHGREVTAGVLELETVQVLPTTEIITPDNAWYDYTHRYTPGLSEHIIPARITDQQRKRVQAIALQAHQLLRCRDFSRSDFIVPQEGEPIFCEINNLPGMTPTSLFPDGARHAGTDFEQLICRLVDNAVQRHAKRDKNDYWSVPGLGAADQAKKVCNS